MKNWIKGLCLLGMMIGALAACEKRGSRTMEADAAVRACVKNQAGQPLPDVEVRIYTADQYEAFWTDVAVVPSLTLRTDGKGEAGLNLDNLSWFAGATTTEVYFVFIQYFSPQNYRYWSAGGTVGIGESRMFSIVAGISETNPVASDFQIENGILTRYTGSTDGVVLLPSEVREIADYCFAGSAVRRVQLNEGLEGIGQFAFYKSALEEIHFPSTLKTLGKHAFEDCIHLVKADLGRTTLTQVSAAAFWGTGLKELLLPETLRQIDAQAFLDTEALRTIVLPEATVSIGTEAFRNSGVEDVQLPNGLRLLGERAFYHCTRLKRVHSAGHFENCEGIVDVGCFEGSLLLESVELPLGTAELKGWTFIGCDKLTAVTVPEGVVRIGYDGLDGGSIGVVTFRGTVPPQLDSALPAYEYLEAIYVPAVSLKLYKEKYPNYADKIRPLE